MLKEKDIYNAELISDLLCSCEIASLYVCTDAGLEKKFSDRINPPFYQYGEYEITEMGEDYMVVTKHDTAPEWDFEKLSIVPELEYYDVSEISDTPQDFHLKWKKGDLEVEYFNIKKVGRKRLLTGNLSVNKEVIPNHRFGGPFLFSRSSIIIPLYFKRRLFYGFGAARINLADCNVTLPWKINKMVFLDKVIRQSVFYYTDPDKRQSDYVKMDGIYGS
jgi:hypothetical protein